MKQVRHRSNRIEIGNLKFLGAMGMRKFSQKQTSQGSFHTSPALPKAEVQFRPIHPVQRLQQIFGNQAVMRMLRKDSAPTAHTSHPILQAQLAVNTPGDVYQQEADRVSQQVMRMPEPQIQRSCACGGACENCQKEKDQSSRSQTPPLQRLPIQRMITGSADVAGSGAPPIVDKVLHSPGQPLDAETRAFMEPRFGGDFGNVRVHTDAQAAQSAHAVNARAYTVGRDVVFAGNEFSPATNAGRSLLAHELTHVVQQSGTPERVQRSSLEDALAENIAEDIDAHAWGRRDQYQYIRQRFAEIGSDLEDNVGADFVKLQDDNQLERMATTAEGRLTLDVLYQAIITGDVSDFEREQAGRILNAKRNQLPGDKKTAEKELTAIANERPMIFPVRNTGLTRISAAVFKAELSKGQVQVQYTSERVYDDMFKEDRETLLPWHDLTGTPVVLDPQKIVYVRLYDDGGKLLPVPALALIDFANQSARSSVGKGMTAFYLGLTLGSGALAGAAEETVGEIEAGEATAATTTAALRTAKIAKTLLWADRVAFGIQTLSLVLDEFRDKLPSFVVEALDVANRITAYYGWGRMGIDGFRFIKSEMGPALSRWQSEVPPEKLSAAERSIQSEMESIVNEIDQAEREAGTQAVKYADDQHLPAPGKPGNRHVDLKDGHEIVEVVEGGVIACEYHSPGGPRVPCPKVLGEGAPQKSEDTSPSADANRVPVSGAQTPRAPQIVMGDVKSISGYRKGIRHISEMEGRGKYATNGNIGIAMYDRDTGDVFLQVLGPAAPGQARKIIFEDRIGHIAIPPGRTPIQIGGDVEEEVRDLVRKATGQNFPAKRSNAPGPDLVAP